MIFFFTAQTISGSECFHAVSKPHQQVQRDRENTSGREKDTTKSKDGTKVHLYSIPFNSLDRVHWGLSVLRLEFRKDIAAQFVSTMWCR